MDFDLEYCSGEYYYFFALNEKGQEVCDNLIKQSDTEESRLPRAEARSFLKELRGYGFKIRKAKPLTEDSHPKAELIFGNCYIPNPILEKISATSNNRELLQRFVTDVLKEERNLSVMILDEDTGELSYINIKGNNHIIALIDNHIYKPKEDFLKEQLGAKNYERIFSE